MSTSRVVKVTPCATAANPPITTNSTCASTSLRVNSFRFCIPFFHGSAERVRETQRVFIGLHPFPRCSCQAVLKQRNVYSLLRGFAAETILLPPFPHGQGTFHFARLELVSARLHPGIVAPGPITVKLRADPAHIRCASLILSGMRADPV